MAVKKAAKKKRPEEDEEDDVPNDWRKSAKQRLNEKSAGDRITLAEGDNCLRILPDRKDIVNGVPKKKLTHQPYREYHMHYGLGPDEKGITACGYDIDGNGECWLCDEKIPELEALPKKAAVAERIARREAFLVQASAYEDGKFGTPKPWSVSTGSGKPGRQKESLAVRVMSKLTGSKKDYLDPIKGYNLNIERSGTGLFTRYPSVEGDDSPTEVPEAILRKIVDLDTLVPVYDEKDQQDAYEGRERGRKDEDEDEDEDEETEDTEETNGDDESDDDAEESDDDAEESDDDDAEESDDADDDAEESDDDADDADDDAEESDDDDDEEEEEEPAPKKKVKAPAKKAPVKKKR